MIKHRTEKTIDMRQVVAYKRLKMMENRQAKKWSQSLTTGGRTWQFDCTTGKQLLSLPLLRNT